MKSMIIKSIEQGTSRDGSMVKIEGIKIKQSAGPLIVKQMKEMTHVRALVIKACRLKVLPNEIEQLAQLKRLHVEDNKLVEIPSLEHLDQLEELNLSNNEVARFQVSISKLTRLRILDLSVNQLGTIPVRLFGMSSLRELVLDSNHFSTFPGQLCELTMLESLSFADNQLKSIPSTIGQLKSLCKLVFAGNQLEQLPAEITSLTQLTYLDVSSNNIKHLPQQMSAFGHLVHLAAQHNKLRVLPEEIGTCTALSVVRINNNTLTHLPASLGKLTNLTELYAHENRLLTLPPEIGGCQSLKKMSLEYNKISILPVQIRQLHTLNLLTLHDNCLEELPSFLQLDFIQHLVRITLHNNSCYDQLFNTNERNNNSSSIDIDTVNILIQHLSPTAAINLNNSINSNHSLTSSSNSSNLNGVGGGTITATNLSSIGEDEDDCTTSSPGHHLSNSFNPSPVGLNNSYNSSPFPRSPANSSILSTSLSGTGTLKKKGSVENSLSKMAMHKGLNLSRGSIVSMNSFADFSSDDDDSDTDSTISNSSINQLNSSGGAIKRSSISPRTSVSMSGGSIAEMLHQASIQHHHNNGNGNSNSNNGNGHNNGHNNGGGGGGSPLNNSNGFLSSPSRSRKNSGGGDLVGSTSSLSLREIPTSASSNSLLSISTSGGSVPTLSRSTSSLLNMLTRRKSISTQPAIPGSVHSHSPLSNSTSGTSSPQSPTSTPQFPTYKSFQTIFESLIEELDYSKKRRDELYSLSSDDKWLFLQRLKPDCVNCLINHGILNYQNQPNSSELKSLISSPPKLNVSQSLSSPKLIPPANLSRIPKSPRGYAKILSNHSLFNYDDICKLRQQLTDKTVTWVINFAESSGIIAILSMISTFSTKDPKSDEDYLVIQECLSCLKLLIQLQMHSILLCDTVDTIFQHVQSNNLNVKKITLEVLDILCKTFSIGASVVMDAIRGYSKRNGIPLSKSLSYIHSPLDADLITIDLKLHCMSLINHLIRGCKDLSNRVDVRNEFLSIGILRSIKSLRIDGEGVETSSWKILEGEMQSFERMMVDDDSYVVAPTNNSSQLPNHSPALESSSSFDTSSNLSNETFSISNNTFNSSAPSTPKAGQVLDPFEPLFDSRLVVRIACNTNPRQQQQQDTITASTTMDSLDDQSSTISSTTTIREVLVPISKKSTAGDVIRIIISSNSNLKEFGEWGLYVNDQQQNNNNDNTSIAIGRFLREDEYILEQSTANTNGTGIRSLITHKQYTLKMVPWKVRLSLEKVKDIDGATNIIEEPMDPTITCAALVDHIVKRYLPSVTKYCLESDDFGLYLDSVSWGGGSGGYWLEPLEKLHDYEIFKDPKLTVQLKLRQKLVKLKFADDTFEQLRLDLTSPTEKIFAEISEKVMDPSNKHNLSYYGIFVDRQESSATSSSLITGVKNKKPEWIEPGVPLYHYRISSRVCLRYAVRPSQISLNVDCSLFTSLVSPRTIQPIVPQSDHLLISEEDHQPERPQTLVLSDDDDDDDEDINNNNSNDLTSSVKVDLDNNSTVDVASLMNVPAPIKPKTVVVQIPLHLPLSESLETEDNWLECLIDQSKCRFHIDSFDGPIVNRKQPLNSQNFSTKNCLYVVLADEAEMSNSEFQNHNNTNIWEEQMDRSTIIYDEVPSVPATSRDTSISTNTTTATIAPALPPISPSNIIRAATLNKLVEVSTNNIDVDRESMNILLMTYQSFTTSDMLLDKLIERYNVPESEEKQKKVIQLHVIVFIKNWLEQQSPQAASGGGLEERFLDRINVFIERLRQDGYSNMVPQLKKLYDAAIKGKRAYAIPEMSRVNISTKLPSLATSLLDDELFVAQQLTVREYETFKRCQIVEFLNQAWNKPKLQYKAPNLLKMIDRFNKVSMAVSTAILAQAKPKPRIKLIGRFIKIAQHLRDLNNFHLLTAFLAGIRNSSVLRLRISWSKISKKNKQTLEDLEKIMSMEGSFKCFRGIIKDIIPPCIPYLGVYLKDLTFIEDGNSDSIDGLVNWGKKKLMYNIISIIQKCQQIPYDFPLTAPQKEKADMVLAYFDSLPIADDEVLYQISQQLEPKTMQQ